MENQFSSLSAESDVSRFAQVSCEEVFAPEAPFPIAPSTPALDRAAAAVVGSYAGKGPNVGKLVRHNLRQPLAFRISRLALISKLQSARMRGAMVGLWAEIHAACEPAREARRRHDDAVDAL